jgi:hypothetical protein
MDEIPDRARLSNFLANDNVFSTSLDTRCRKVQLNRSM